MINDQMTIKEYIDPFKGEQVKKIAVVGSKIPLKRLLALVPYRAQRKTTCYTRGFLFILQNSHYRLLGVCLFCREFITLGKITLGMKFSCKYVIPLSPRLKSPSNCIFLSTIL